MRENGAFYPPVNLNSKLMVVKEPLHSRLKRGVEFYTGGIFIVKVHNEL